jgi:hypothetical protein
LIEEFSTNSWVHAPLLTPKLILDVELIVDAMATYAGSDDQHALMVLWASIAQQ